MVMQKNESMPWLVTGLLLLFPAVALLVHNAGNAIVLLMLLLSLTLLLRRKTAGGVVFSQAWKVAWPLHLAMVSACLAVFCQQLWAGHFAFKFYDRGLRLAIFPLLFWLMFAVPGQHIKLLRWSFVLATVLATVKAYMLTDGGHVRNGNIGYLSIIAYSDITLLTGVLSVIALGWDKQPRLWSQILMGLVCVAGLYTSILTATRGSLLAIPFFIALFLVAVQVPWRTKLLGCGAVVLVLVLLFSASDTARTRLLNTQIDLANYSQADGKSTSTGIRLQLWGAALKLFAGSPIFGIGRENYDPAIAEMASKHEVSPELTALAHSHNEILFNMAVSGMVGLASILAIYLVPAYFFARELRHGTRNVRTAACMGVTLVLGFFAFGLTDLMFFWPTLGGDYVLLLAALLAFIVKEKRAEVLS